jgi:hypothetical protein
MSGPPVQGRLGQGLRVEEKDDARKRGEESGGDGRPRRNPEPPHDFMITAALFRYPCPRPLAPGY